MVNAFHSKDNSGTPFAISDNVFSLNTPKFNDQLHIIYASKFTIKYITGTIFRHISSITRLYKYVIRIHFCVTRTRRINFSYYMNKLFSLWINFPGTLWLCTAEGADKYETGTNVTRTTKKTSLTKFMKGEEWCLFLGYL
jgi:hypothetical protein